MHDRGEKNIRGCFPAAREFVLEETQYPGEPSGSEILVECLYSLISAGTELAIYTQTHRGFSEPNHPFARFPFYPGYAAVGNVIRTGPESSLREGDVVFYAGGHARFCLVRPGCLMIEAGPETPVARVPFVQLATVAATARRLSAAPIGGVAVVFGLGLVGNFAGQLFQLAGFRVIGIDRSSARCELAHQTGIVETVVPTDSAASSDEVLRLTGGTGADVVVEATGSPAAVEPALKVARRGGEVILLGSTRGTVELDVYSLIHQKGVIVRGAHASLIPSAPSQDGGPSPKTAVATEMLRLIEQEKLQVSPLISRRISPTEMAEMYRVLADDPNAPIGVLVDWGQSG